MNKKETGRKLISQIEIKVVIHSTEDESKIKKVIKSLLPVKPNDSDFNIKLTKGYYGNPLKLLTLSILNKDEADMIFHYLLSHLPDESKMFIVDTLYERLDVKGNLYLRFDKHSSELKIRDDDPVRIRIRFRKFVDTPRLRTIILGSN